MGDVAIHSPIRIGSISTIAWGGIFRCEDWTGTVDSTKSVTMLNTSIFNSDTQFLISPANSGGRSILKAGDAISGECTSNGTVTFRLATAASLGAVADADFFVVAIRGGLTTIIA